MKKQFACLLAALMLLPGCGAISSQPQAVPENPKPQSSQAAAVAADSLSLYPAAANLPVGRELKLKATLSPAGANATWASSDEAVATVDEGGKVTAKAPGECTVTVASGGKSAECTVLVEEDCRTVIFATKPIKGDGENPPEPPQGGEPGETPIELPPEVIDVAHIPQADEFIWTLEFDETFTTLVTNDDIPLIVDVTIYFKAEKRGGKTAEGTYTGTFSGDADLDKENFIKVMNEQMAGEGGKLTDYTETDEGLQNAQVTVEITPMDNEAYHEAEYSYIPPEERTGTLALPFPFTALLPGTLMALGEVSGMVTISGTMTMVAMGQTITAPFGAADNSAQPYTVRIYPSGDAVLTFPLMAKDGFDRNWVEGMLTKRPLV